MFSDKDLLSLIAQSGVHLMPNGWRVVIKAHWADGITPQCPHGLRYALVLKDHNGDRRLGFDNSHGFDGASPDDPFDHEHRPGRPGRRYRYPFTTAAALLADFFERAIAHCEAEGVAFEFEVEEDLS
jgi:Family of unknown function (DUF6516)